MSLGMGMDVKAPRCRRDVDGGTVEYVEYPSMVVYPGLVRNVHMYH